MVRAAPIGRAAATPDAGVSSGSETTDHSARPDVAQAPLLTTHWPELDPWPHPSVRGQEAILPHVQGEGERWVGSTGGAGMPSSWRKLPVCCWSEAPREGTRVAPT